MVSRGWWPQVSRMGSGALPVVQQFPLTQCFQEGWSPNFQLLYVAFEPHWWSARLSDTLAICTVKGQRRGKLNRKREEHLKGRKRISAAFTKRRRQPQPQIPKFFSSWSGWVDWKNKTLRLFISQTRGGHGNYALRRGSQKNAPFLEDNPPQKNKRKQIVRKDRTQGYIYIIYLAIFDTQGKERH